MRRLSLLAAFALLAACDARAESRIAYVAFPTLAEPALLEAGKLSLPVNAGGGKMPAVLIVHGSAGVDSRGQAYADALNEAGIATLEIDMWSARGTARGPGARPQAVPETLPDAYGALKFLTQQPEIDPARIGIMGFSWGGVVTMLTATHRYADPNAAQGLHFAARAAFYPVCWSYNHVPGYEFGNLTPAPLLIQAGARDTYDEPNTCTELVDGLAPTDKARIRLIVYPDATHAFDRTGAPVTVDDPHSHLGKGGPVRFEYNKADAEAAKRELLDFFKGVFAAG